MPIEREIRFVTAGNSNTTSQVFYNNYLADSTPVETDYFSFYKPGYYTYGGTLDYLSQDPFAIFTNLIKPPIRFKFTSHTESLTGDSYFIHEIYKLDYDTYKLYSDNQIANSQKVNNSISKNNKESAPLNSIDLNNSNGVKFGNNEIPVPEKLFGQSLTSSDKNTIQSYFDSPFITFTAATSAITGNVYDLFLDEYVKNLGEYKSQLFKNKGQYFINTKMVFNINLGKDYTDFYTLNTSIKSGVTTFTAVTAISVVTGATGPITIVTGVTTQTAATAFFSQNVLTSEWNNTQNIISSNNIDYKISSGPFTGTIVRGNYFSYFEVPDKPSMEYPIMQGQLSTFTPEFRWSNGDRADSFLMQINYNTVDTGFTGSSVINYPVEKNEKNEKTIKNRLKDPTIETETEKTIYFFQVPMKSNKQFIWRVGNSVELIDIFNVRRNVVTFSEYYSATSQSEAIRTYVVSESDSPFIEHVAGFDTPPSLDYESEVAEYILNGTISGSTVTGATVQLTYPNSAYTISMTDSGGTYSFSGLQSGMYTLTTDYRGYQQDIRTINITSNTTENFKLHLIWGNNVDTWGKMAGESYYT